MVLTPDQCDPKQVRKLAKPTTEGPTQKALKSANTLWRAIGIESLVLAPE